MVTASAQEHIAPLTPADFKRFDIDEVQLSEVQSVWLRPRRLQRMDFRSFDRCVAIAALPREQEIVAVEVICSARTGMLWRELARNDDPVVLSQAVEDRWYELRNEGWRPISDKRYFSCPPYYLEGLLRLAREKKLPT